jgi:hypothetical protein
VKLNAPERHVDKVQQDELRPNGGLSFGWKAWKDTAGHGIR